MITFVQHGNYKKTESWFQKLLEKHHLSTLDKYGKEGVAALAANTPRDTGKTASSWEYRINHSEDSVSIIWSNTNFNKGVPIAVIIQYGHGTGTGGYVRGIDYINPAMRPVFEKIANNVWKEVRKV